MTITTDSRLYIHQQRCLEIAHREPLFGFGLDTGTGKTRLGLAIAEAFGKTLVLTKLSIVETWLEEAEKMGSPLTVASGWGPTPKARRAAFEAIDTADVFVLNYESAKLEMDRLLRQPWQVVLFDESSVFKSHTTATSKMGLVFAGLRQYRRAYHTVPRLYCLSATPTPNGAHEWFTQGMMTGVWSYESHYMWRQTWFYQPEPYLPYPKWELDPSKRDAFEQALGRRWIFIKKDDCLDLPEQVFETRSAYLTPPEEAAYKALVNDWIYRHGDDEVLATSALTELMKCRQMLGGVVKSSVNGEPLELAERPAKMRVLLEVVEETPPDERLIVVIQFRHEAEKVYEELRKTGVLVGLITGAVSKTGRDSAIRMFNEGITRILICHPQAAGHGLNLQVCSRMVWYSLSYSAEQWKQMCDRIHRSGQAKPCEYTVLLARTKAGRKTVDHTIYEAVQGKVKLHEALMERLKP